MTYTGKIEKILVVLSPDLIKPDQPGESTLIKRAVALTRKTGCELELFHVCYSDELAHQLFASDSDRERHKRKLTDHDATLLAEIGARLLREGVAVQHEARWDAPRSDAILRKIAESKPDIVMKQSREHDYVLGLTTNTDWELARRSPVPCWLVNDKVESIDTILAAIGNDFGDPAAIATAADYELLQTAALVGRHLESETHAVNAYQVVEPHSFVGDGAGGAVAPASAMHEFERLRAEVVRQHEASVMAITGYCDVSNEHVHVCEGRPAQVIPETAESIDADLIVMGARGIGRLERIIRSVTVEPVMAETEADILVINDSERAEIPEAAHSPYHGSPNYNIERAITQPEEIFDSPLEVAGLPQISTDLRERILQAWEYDIRAEMAEENEGGPVRDIDVSVLDEIHTAKEQLEKMQRRQICLN